MIISHVKLHSLTEVNIEMSSINYPGPRGFLLPRREQERERSEERKSLVAGGDHAMTDVN